MEQERLDVRVARMLDITRSRAEKLIRDGHVTVGGAAATRPGQKVAQEADVSATLPPPAIMEAVPQNLPLEIVYEDAHIAVVNKPAGMVVHPAAGTPDGTLVNALLYHLKDLSGIGGTLRPGIVHRLDKDTSGLLLVAKNDAAHQALADAFKAREVHKTYQAVAYGGFRDDAGVIDAPIARHPVDRKRMAVVADGRPARTEYAVAERLRGAALLHVNLITGRTHQIRVHMAHIGHPLLGDAVYAPKRVFESAPCLMLHAWRVAFAHPVTGEAMSFAAAPPETFAKTLRRLGNGNAG